MTIAVIISALIAIAVCFLAARFIGQRKQIDGLIADIEAALTRQRVLLDYENGFLMKKDWDAETDRNAQLYKNLIRIPASRRKSHPKSDIIAAFIENHADEEVRVRRNEAFKASELTACDSMLSNIDGKSLDDQQRNAVVTDEYNNLVIAGAGSGKTLTVVGKIKYLTEHRGVRPEEILVTSFTRKSVNELQERIEKAGIKGVTCKTFHKMGLDRLGKVGVANENELRNCVLSYLRGGIQEYPDQMSAYIEFYGCYKHVPKDYSEFESEGARFEALKATSLETIKGQLDTLNGERVKSIEELMIANYLFLHGVDYEYERNYDGDYETNGRAYQPDFYLPEYDIWLEHFGVDEHGRCPWIETDFEERKYIEGMDWKRSVHEANGTRLIESYSFWNKDHDLLNKLEALLEANGVELVSDEEMLSGVYAKLSQDDKYLRSIATLTTTFLSLAKANNIAMAEVAEKGRDAYKGDGFMWHRFELFMAFAEPIMTLYSKRLEDKGQVDFDDMINKAASLIAEEGPTERFRYIIVDEYQDISKSRFGLIKAIRDACEAKLMCVGDDWQSIYRFAGSDVSLFTDFGEYVGFHETLKIERTYRNSQELVDIASAFVERNPAQVHKTMKSFKHEDMPVVISYMPDMANGLEASLSSILQMQDGGMRKILILGRHNFDIETLYPDFKGQDSFENENISLRRDRNTGDVHVIYGGNRNITFMSVHRAKGLEADDVVVLNLINDMYGFPNRIEDDPILQILLGGDEELEFAEERRLFYVAITRTKRRVFLVSGALDKGAGPSPFVGEIRALESEHLGAFEIEGKDVWNPTLCPRCGTGRLVVRRNSQTGRSFLGCTNFPFCERSYDQTEILEDRLKCPACDGWMVRRRRGSDGKPFFGCSNWPDCTATIDATEEYEPAYSAPKAVTYASVRFNSDNSYRDAGHGKPDSKKCPKCGAPLKLMKNSKDGSQFFGCTRYPTCRYTRNVDDVAWRASAPGHSGGNGSTAMRCPKCGAKLKELTNKKDGSIFYGCTRYPACKYTRNK
ncbi:UvrD-helicase domain-containing protein [Denitrobacterium detoxificans]|uniref:UvrD-helicase domain-containing protein n=1 Tax=Denitrobacterium detoxificans TaxID=79604 RepID=UPI0026F27440|nr:UvrD-helicase domain-containing protein [Denitrobacterium detoxificans]